MNNILHPDKIPTSSIRNHNSHLQFGRHFESILFNNIPQRPHLLLAIVSYPPLGAYPGDGSVNTL